MTKPGITQTERTCTTAGFSLEKFMTLWGEPEQVHVQNMKQLAVASSGPVATSIDASHSSFQVTT